MSNFERYEDKVWDTFFDDIQSDVGAMSRAEVQSQLKERRIDISRAVARVHRAIASAKAKAELAVARSKRQSVLEKLTGVIVPEIENLQQTIGNMIAHKLQGSSQAAYFRKLQEAAGDDDLRALLNDIERLDALSQDENESP